MKKSLLLSLVGLAALVAQDSGGIGGPVTGFIFDSRAGALRPIEGLPGAARLGSPVSLPFALASAAIASRRDYALVTPLGGDGRPMLVRELRSGAPRVAPIEGAMQPSAVAISASGAVAALYSNATRNVQFVVGLPSSPAALDPIDASAVESSTAFAIDRDGAAALIAASDGWIHIVRRAEATLTSVARVPGVSSLGFLPDRAAAVAAGAETGDVVLLEGLDGAVSIRGIAGSAKGFSGIRSVQALDAQSVGVVTADARLAAVDIETGSVEWIPLAGDAEHFEALDSALFVLNRAGAQPLLLLDSKRGHSAWFVPPDRAVPELRGLPRPLPRAGERSR